MKAKTKKEKRPSGLGYLLLAVVSAAIGFCFFAFGREMLELLALIIGIIVTLSGVVFAIITLSHKERGLGFGIRIVAAACILICGICTMILRKPAIEILINVFALLIIVDGSFKLNSAILAHRERSRSFVFLTVISTATIACGFLAITYIPHVYTLGAGVLIDAIANTFSAFYIPSLLKAIFGKEEKASTTEAKENATQTMDEPTETEPQETQQEA